MSTRAKQRNSTRELQEAVNDCVEQFGIPAPGVFLAHLMAGVDPRLHSPLITYMQTLATRHPDALPDDAWQRLRELVKDLPPFGSVDVDMSATAARALMPYLYAKKKDIEISGGLTVSDLPPVEMSDAQRRELAEKIKKDLTK